MDMWDRHWCVGATQRAIQLAPRINQTIQILRQKGAFIIHSPSDCGGYYSPENKKHLIPAEAAAYQTGINAYSKHHPPNPNAYPEFFVPFVDSDGGCDDSRTCCQTNVWYKQTSLIPVDQFDVIAADGLLPSVGYYGYKALIALLAERPHITNVVYCGIHANMCISHTRSNSMMNVNPRPPNLQFFLITDLTDTIYNSRSAPWVCHFSGTDILVDSLLRQAYAKPLTSDIIIGNGPIFKF